MGTTPTTTNEIAEIINQVISAFMSGGEAAAEAYLTALDPALLALPPIAWLMDEGVGYLGQILSVAGQKFVDSIVIDIVSNQEKSSVITTATAFQFALGSGNQAAITQASQNLSTAYANLIHWDGNATPI